MQTFKLLNVAPLSSHYANKIDLGDIYVPNVTMHGHDTASVKIYSNRTTGSRYDRRRVSLMIKTARIKDNIKTFFFIRYRVSISK